MDVYIEYRETDIKKEARKAESEDRSERSMIRSVLERHRLGHESTSSYWEDCLIYNNAPLDDTWKAVRDILLFVCDGYVNGTPESVALAIAINSSLQCVAEPKKA